MFLFTLVIFFEWTVCITEGLNSRIWEIPSVFISHWCLIHVFGLKTKRQIVDCHSGQFSQQIHYSRRIASVYCWKMELTISFFLEWVIINNKKRECVSENINRRLVFEHTLSWKLIGFLSYDWEKWKSILKMASEHLEL